MCWSLGYGRRQNLVFWIFPYCGHPSNAQPVPQSCFLMGAVGDLV